MKKVILILSIIMFFGCALPIRVMSYSDNKYPATQNVDVFRTKPVDKKYIEIAELRTRVGALNRDKAIVNLRKKAMEIGADAIILLGEENQGMALLNTTSSMPIATNLTDMVVIAIVYTDKD